MATREHQTQGPTEPPSVPLRPIERADQFPLANPKVELRASEGTNEPAQTSNNSQLPKGVTGQVSHSSNEGETSGLPPSDSHVYGDLVPQEPRYPSDARQPRPIPSQERPRARHHSKSRRSQSFYDRARTEPLARDEHVQADSRPRPLNARRLEELLDESEDRVEKLKRQNKKIDRDYQRLKQDFDEVTADAEELREDLMAKERQITALQGEYLEMSKGMGPSQAEDDDVVRDKIRSCTSTWRQWAKKYAIQDLSEVKHEARNDVEMLFAACSAPGNQPATSWIWSSEFSQTLPRMILHASLAKMMADTVIKEPFYNLIAPVTPGSDGVARDLDFVYREAQKDDPIVAHAWRSHTVHIFNKYMLRKDPVTTSRTVPRRDNYYRQLAAWFEHSSARNLFRDDGTVSLYQRQEELYTMLQDTGELFLNLWAQKVLITTWGIEELKSEAFHIKSKYMEPHVWHGLKDGDDTRLDGRQVSSVVQPAVIAYGNEHGRNYDQHKVWAKAVVFLDSPLPAKLPVRKR